MIMASIKEIRDLIAEHPFFKGLPPEYIDLIAGCARNVRFMPGEFVIREGEPAEAFYVIRAGKVLIGVYAPEQGLLPIQTVGPGEVVGWSWLFPPYRWQFDAKAVELTRALAFDGKCLREKCEQDPRLGYELMRRFARIIAGRLQAARLQLLDLYGTPSQRQHAQASRG